MFSQYHNILIFLIYASVAYESERIVRQNLEELVVINGDDQCNIHEQNFTESVNGSSVLFEGEGFEGYSCKFQVNHKDGKMAVFYLRKELEKNELLRVDMGSKHMVFTATSNGYECVVTEHPLMFNYQKSMNGKGKLSMRTFWVTSKCCSNDTKSCQQCSSTKCFLVDVDPDSPGIVFTHNAVLDEPFKMKHCGARTFTTVFIVLIIIASIILVAAIAASIFCIGKYFTERKQEKGEWETSFTGKTSSTGVQWSQGDDISENPLQPFKLDQTPSADLYHTSGFDTKDLYGQKSIDDIVSSQYVRKQRESVHDDGNEYGYF